MVEEESHPLELFVYQAFKDGPSHDGTSLGLFLAGAYRRAGASAAYAKVAREVLSCMEKQGKLYRDGAGWWRMV